MLIVGNSSRGRSQGVPKIFMAPMYTAHCAVIFAIAQLSCHYMESPLQLKTMYVYNICGRSSCVKDSRSDRV